MPDIPTESICKAAAWGWDLTGNKLSKALWQAKALAT